MTAYKSKVLLIKMKTPEYTIVHEQLGADGPQLTSIYFRFGGNFFIFSYPQDGITKHTLIDTGDIRHAGTISSILRESHIDPQNIERIIITHSHPDHYGLAYLLVKGSDAKILVHANFKNVIEGNRTNFERRWLGLHDPEELKDCNVEYLSPKNGKGAIDIYGLEFPRLVEPISFGGAGELEILAIPESADMHTHDQIIALFSARDFSQPYSEAFQKYRPSDDMIFSGDLWLMQGPLFDRKLKGFNFYFRRAYFRLRRWFTGKGWSPNMVMEQDLAVKEALKEHFSLIKVKPGHGQEFLGTRILPQGLPADRDILNELGYSTDTEIAEADAAQLAAKIAQLKEVAYARFAKEILFWQKQGYSIEEIADFLVRIYKEQIGGSKAVAIDRQQRRERLKVTLSRLQQDTAVPKDLHQLAETTMAKLEKI
jgi:hypothetical protein